MSCMQILRISTADAKLFSFFPKVNYNQKRNTLAFKNKEFTKTKSVH